MEEEEGTSEESKKKNRRKRKTPHKLESSTPWKGDLDLDVEEEDPFAETRLSNSIPRNHCPICGDRANGLHYGIYTCEGCKNFFKRSIVAIQDKPYFCKFNNECDISVFDPDGVKRNRLRCQACRYQACLDAGMYHSGSLQPRVGRPRKSSRMEHHSEYLLEEGSPTTAGVDSTELFEVRDLQYEVDLLRSKNRELTQSLKEKEMQLSISEKQISNLKSQIQRLNDRRLTNNNVSSSSSPPSTNGRSGSLFKDGNVTITPIMPGKTLNLSNLEIKEEEEEDMATIEAVSNNLEAQPATTIKKWKINSYNILDG